MAIWFAGIEMCKYESSEMMFPGGVVGAHSLCVQYLITALLMQHLNRLFARTGEDLGEKKEVYP